MTTNNQKSVSSIVEQYKDHSDQQLCRQIKVYESTAETHLAKAKRCWAYAKNDKGGHYYHEARVAYLLFQRRQRDGATGVILEHSHLDSIGENGGNHRQVVLDALGRQAPVTVGLICPRLTQAVDKLLNLPGRNLIHVEVTNGGI